MEIQPRYEGPPILALDGGDEVGPACIRQRRRLQATLASLSDDQWRAPSRCEGWSVQDVATHLAGTNRFWQLSITAGLDGSPTRLLTGFDPKATPAALVEAAGAPSPAETLAELAASNDALCDLLASLDGGQWSRLAEAPAGHIPIRLLAHHALWDSWVHERDIALPLGLPTTEEPDEVMACLRFAAALGPALALTRGTAGRASLVLETIDPEGCVVVEVGDQVVVHDRAPAAPTVTVRDSAVDLVEALSCRAPFTHPVPATHRWLIDSLAEIFETEPAG